MPSFFSNVDQSRLPIVAGIGLVTAATAGLSFVYWYRKRLAENTIPKRWRRVGELSDLICYPIKSCGPIRVTEIGCSKIGLEDGYLRDRIFMVITVAGEFITARQYPKLVLIQPKIVDTIMKLSAPGMINVEVNMERLYQLTPIKCSVWGEQVDAVDAGEDVARWLSRFILSEDFGLRLVFYPKDLSTRDVRPKNKIFDTMTPEDTGAFHDATSFMLFNESSLIDLNSRLENPTAILNFRPNFVVKGPLAYEEDYWKWIRIGSDVIFKNIKPCTRCIFTNINPLTAVRSPDDNPLKTLKSYRKFTKTGESPVLGIHLGLRNAGKISIGDSVYVEYN